MFLLDFRCEAVTEEDPYLKWLVSDSKGLLYRNLYCAICHGVNKENIIYWLAKITCSNKYYSLLNSSSSASSAFVDEGKNGNGNSNKKPRSEGKNSQDQRAASLQQQLISGECKIKYSSPRVKSKTVHTSLSSDGNFPDALPDGYRTCKSSVSKCPDSWLQNPSGEEQCIKQLCESDDNTHYVYFNFPLGPTYKNEYCARCHSISMDTLSCRQLSLIQFSKASHGFYPLAIVMDLNNGGRSAMRTKVGYELSEEKKKSATRMLQCPDDHVFDPFQKTCIALVCSEGFVYTDNECRQIASSTLSVASDIITDCVRVPISEYQIYPNGSVYVNSSNRTYDIEHIEISSDGQLLICTDFTQNYTDGQNSTTDPGFILKFSKALTIVSVIGQIISIICLIILLTVYMILPQLRNIPGKNLMCLSASLLVAQILFLTAVGATDNRIFCTIISTVLHYSFLAAFCWINVMSFDIWRTFSQDTVSLGNKRKKFLFYSIYGWLTPFFTIIVSTIVNYAPGVQQIYRPGYAEGLCWITERIALLIFFGAPLALVLTINIIFYIMTIRKLVLIAKSTKAVQQTNENKQRFALYVKLSVIMGLTWIFGFIATMTDEQGLWYVFVILNSLQGAFICISFVITKKVGRLLREKWRQMRKEVTTTTSEDTGTKSTMLSTSTTTKSMRPQLNNTKA